MILCTFTNFKEHFASVGLTNWQIISKSSTMVKLKIEACLSSKSAEWATPREFFAQLDKEFHFNLDPCSTHENAKCEKHYTIEADGLSQDWGGTEYFATLLTEGKYPSGSESDYESRKPNTIVVMLIPARTDTSYFHEYIYGKAKEIRFIRGRLHFNDGKEGAPFPSMVVVF